MSFIPPYRTPTDDYTQTSTDTSGGFYGSRYPGRARINNMPIIGSDALFPSIQKILERYAAMDNFDPNVQGKQLAEELNKDPNVRGFTDPDSVMMNERGEVVDKEEEDAQVSSIGGLAPDEIPDEERTPENNYGCPVGYVRDPVSDACVSVRGEDPASDPIPGDKYDPLGQQPGPFEQEDIDDAMDKQSDINDIRNGELDPDDMSDEDLADIGLTRDQAEDIYGELDSLPEEPLGDPDGSSESPYSGSDRLLESEYDKEVWDQTSKDYEEGKDITVCEGDICYTVNKRTHDMRNYDQFITTETGTYGKTRVVFSPKTDVDVDAPEETNPTEETNQDDTEEGGRDSGGSPGGESGDPGGQPGEEGREGGSPSGVPTEGGGSGPGGGEGTSRVPTLPGGAQTPDDEGNKKPPEEPIYTGDEPLGPDEVEVIIWIPEDKRTPENIEAFCDAYPGFCEAWEKTTGEPYDGSPMATKRPMTEEEILEREREKAEQEQSGGQPSGQPSGQPGGSSGGLGSPSSNTRNAIDWLIRTAANARDIANAGRSSSDTTGEGAATGDTGGTSDTGDGSASTEGTGDGGEDGGTGDGGDGGDGDDAGSGDTTGSGEGGEGDGAGDGT